MLIQYYDVSENQTEIHGACYYLEPLGVSFLQSFRQKRSSGDWTITEEMWFLKEWPNNLMFSNGFLVTDNNYNNYCRWYRLKDTGGWYRAPHQNIKPVKPKRTKHIETFLDNGTSWVIIIREWCST